MRPGTTALLDQADAANITATHIMTALASIEGQPIRHTEPGPVIQALITCMRDRAQADQLTLCLHLTYTTPAPAFWCAWAPGRLRCASCAHIANARIRGTREDRRCDHCHQVGARIHSDLVQLPPVVIDLPPWPAKCIPPITLMFGLCPPCQRADDSLKPRPGSRPA